MAEEDDGSQERTESPSDKRLREARERGQLLRSRELTSALVGLAGFSLVVVMSSWMGKTSKNLFRSCWDIQHEQWMDKTLILDRLSSSLEQAGVVLFPVFWDVAWWLF